jgi:hypothetical protein
MPCPRKMKKWGNKKTMLSPILPGQVSPLGFSKKFLIKNPQLVLKQCQGMRSTPLNTLGIRRFATKITL